MVMGNQARLDGNEGRARVCARRAAGIAVREYLARHGRRSHSLSALDLLEELRKSGRAPSDVTPLIDHLALRVDEEFRLPPGVDLLEEARKLRDTLLPGE
jgi:hypothetical protein